MLFYILYRIGQFIALNLPLKLGYKLAIFFSDLHYMVADKDRQRVRNNLRAIFPDKNEKEIRRIRIRLFRNFAKYLVDFFRYQKLNKEYLEKNIRIENLDYLRQSLAKGKGVIIVSAHLGNWELGAVIVALLGFPIHAVALPHKDIRVNNFFNFQRESKGLKVIPLGRAARNSIEVLMKNEILAIVGDRNFSEKGINMDFFGRITLFPLGPAIFSLKTGADIIPTFMTRNHDDSFTLSFEKAIQFDQADTKDEQISGVVRQYKEIFEQYIRRYPDQWYMFRVFYKG